MLPAVPSLAMLFCTLAASSWDGETLSRRPQFPSPRHSGLGLVAFPASNVQLLGWLTLADFPGGSTTANDCWGYTSPSGREYAVIGLSHGIAFVDVTDPGAPVLVDVETGGVSFWRCVKVHGHHAYAGSEGSGGIRVFDLSDIDAGNVALVATVTAGGCTTATHTLAVDNVSGFLYRAGGNGCAGGVKQGLVAYSLADPALPVPVGSWSTRYVHDCQVVTWDLAGPYLGRELAFCFTQNVTGSGNPLVEILDVTDKANITTVSALAYGGSAFSHQGWLSADKQHLYVNDEADDGGFGPSRTRIVGVADLAAPINLGFFTSGADSIDHNLYVNGNRIYEANYTSGLRVFDNTNPTAPVQIGFFDTEPADDAQEFRSLWSNYPFFASGTVIGSDIEKGLFVWRVGARKLSFDFPGGVPEFLAGGGIVQFTVTEETPGDLQGGTVELHVSTGGAFSTVSATSLGGDLYESVVPSAVCGTAVDFYVSARSTDGVTWTDPPAAPTQVHQALAAFEELVALEDDMETSSGWLVNQPGDVTFPPATSGTWTRVNPVGTPAQPEDDHSDPGVFCWVTGQGAPGGGVGDADVDGGSTALRSPVLDASGLLNPHLSYWRWFSNDQGGNAEDRLWVDISDDGGSSWVNVETVGPTGPDSVGGWIQHSFRIADHVAPTSTVLLRFRVSDLNAGSVVEAAVDDLQLIEPDCTPPQVTIESVVPDSGPFQGGDVVTITGTDFVAGVTTVSFGAVQAGAVSVLDANTLEVRVPRALGPGSGKLRVNELEVDVTVQNPGSASLVDGYTYLLTEESR